MAAFRLPRLKANLAIVNSQGKPLDYFLRFWNIEVAPRIEKNEQEQNDLLQQIIEAQARADAAYALAQDANGAKYFNIDASAPNTFADTVVNNVSENSLFQFSGGLYGGSLDDNSDWTGTISFLEGDGTNFDLLATMEVTVTQGGLIDPGEWTANDSTPATSIGVCSRFGTVTYRVNYSPSGSTSYIQPPDIRSTVILSPPMQ